MNLRPKSRITVKSTLNQVFLTACPLFLLAFSLHVNSVYAGDTPLNATQQLWVNSFDAETGGDYGKAREHMRGIMTVSSESYFPNLRLAWLYYLGKDYTAAISYYKKAARLSPGAVSPMHGLMNCYAALGETEREIKAAKSALLLDPMNYQANIRLAALSYKQGQFDTAGSYYRKLFSLYPEDLTIATGMAWCYLNEGLPKDAATLFQQVLAVHPNYLSAKTGLAACRQGADSTIQKTLAKK